MKLQVPNAKMVKKTISVVGLGDGGREFLSNLSLQVVKGADILIGGERHLAFFPEWKSRKIPIKKNLSRILDTIKDESKEKKIVVLVSGDPFFFGLGRYLVRRLPDFKLSFFPYPSSIQLAFARIGESWDDAALVSVHAGDMNCLLPLSGKHRKIGILTDHSNTPSKIASLLLAAVGDIFTCFVCENIEGEKEKITKGSLRKIMKMDFSPLNVVILIKKDNTAFVYPVSGIADSKFAQRKPVAGLITKSEVRSIALGKMEVKPDSIVWDVGAGSGSVSIEAASFAGNGRVYSMEKNERDLRNIKKNIHKFFMPHVIPIHGTAPECFNEIGEDPDVLFVGGSGGRLEEILVKGFSRLKDGGRFVINLIALENLNCAQVVLKKMKQPFEILSINIGRSSGIQGLTRLESLNAVFIIFGRKC